MCVHVCLCVRVHVCVVVEFKCIGLARTVSPFLILYIPYVYRTEYDFI